MVLSFGRRHLLACIVLATVTVTVAPRGTAFGAAGDDAGPVAQIESFYAALIETMKQGKELGIERRYKKLAPVIDRTFDIPAMTAIAVGSSWSRIPADKQAALIDGFRHMTIASYARNFHSFDGERFDVDPNVIARNANRVVRTQLLQPGKEPISLAYLMHQTNPTWKVIDVYYQGTISQLAARRSEFSSMLGAGGVDALQQKLRDLGDRLMADARGNP